MDTIVGAVATIIVAIAGLAGTIVMARLQTQWADERNKGQWEYEAERRRTERLQAKRDEEIKRVLDYFDRAVEIAGQFLILPLPSSPGPLPKDVRQSTNVFLRQCL